MKFDISTSLNLSPDHRLYFLRVSWRLAVHVRPTFQIERTPAADNDQVGTLDIREFRQMNRTKGPTAESPVPAAHGAYLAFIR